MSGGVCWRIVFNVSVVIQARVINLVLALLITMSFLPLCFVMIFSWAEKS